MLLSCALFSSLLTSTFAASAADWRTRSIYQLVTDRFAVSDNSSPTCDTSTRTYCGGTWQGIIKHLDYIQAMGFDAVWISPVVKNIEDTTAYGQAYHGYWAQDLTTLNSHFGKESDLLALADALHARSMYLMVDVVANHMGSDSPDPLSSAGLTGYNPFNAATDYHPECFIADYNNQTDVEQCWIGDSKVPLMDLNTESDTVVSKLNDWVKNLVSTYKVDGIRIDTVKHVRKPFWPGFQSAAGVFALGEVLDDNTTYTGDYTNYIDSVFDYPGFFTLTKAFSSSSGSVSALVETIHETQTAYKNGGFSTGSFLENQDNPRFQSLTQDQALVKNAITYTFVNDGIPVFYYGQEQGYSGGSDPANREALWFTAYAQDKPLVKHVASLNKARKAAISNSTTFLSSAMTIPASTDHNLAISKPPLLAVMTNLGIGSGNTVWSIPNAGPANQDLVDVLSCSAAKTDASGALSVTFKSGQPLVFLPKSIGGSLCTASAAKTSEGLPGFLPPAMMTLAATFGASLIMFLA